MSSFDWQSVVDIVEKEFPSYIPVPSRDVEEYRILNFMSLAGETKHSGHPRFYYYGSKGDISPSGPSSLMPNPESSSKKLWSCNERANDRGGSSKDNTFSLGTISEHKVSYGDLQNWLCKLINLKPDVKNLAKEQKLFIIHTTIMAEMLVIKEGGEESKAELNRPKEFGSFPIGFKVGKVRLVEVVTGYSPVYYRLQLEDLGAFNRPYSDWWAKYTASNSAK